MALGVAPNEGRLLTVGLRWAWVSIHFVAQTIGDYSLYQMDAVSDYYLAVVHRQLPSILGQLKVFRLGNTPQSSAVYFTLFVLLIHETVAVEFEDVKDVGQYDQRLESEFWATVFWTETVAVQIEDVKDVGQYGQWHSWKPNAPHVNGRSRTSIHRRRSETVQGRRVLLNFVLEPPQCARTLPSTVEGAANWLDPVTG
ncbi:hypothetical protein K438DRAFT_1776079 [Mycena galopus ATCC 62051]|nr:hypothetical protein K438DRAFT_1776079 [Mycena galopus ATCC 62051]